jgi:hypothetical protein
MTMDFCTYFDSAYLAKAIVCRHTLMAQTPARLFVLCLDAEVERAVAAWDDAVPITLGDIEAYRPELLSVKGRRLAKEYYATITPTLPQFLFDRLGLDKVFYTDADMAFWSPAEEIAEVMGDRSLLVTPHENPVAVAGGAGHFNVGILGYRNDRDCRVFLQWWEAKCLEWCEWRALPDGRCADQGYLSVLHAQPNRFAGVVTSPPPGINLGPWNLALHRTSGGKGKIILDDAHNLVCYHYHGYKNIDGQCVNNTGWEVSPWNMENIYKPYHELILMAQAGTLR